MLWHGSCRTQCAVSMSNPPSTPPGATDRHAPKSLRHTGRPHPGPRAARGDILALGQAVKLVERAPDPHGSPRPFRDARDVPLRTSLYLELATPPAQGRRGEPRLGVGEPAPGRRRGRRAAPARPPVRGGRLGLAAAEERPLGRPVARRLHRAPRAAQARDAIHGDACASAGARPSPLTPAPGASPPSRPARRIASSFRLDLAAEPVRWHGRFFSGICNVIFCSQAAKYGPTYDLMAEARKQHPRAWSYQRDFWPTGTEFRPPSSFLPNLPNIVRERETRRIAAIEPREGERRAPRRGRLRPRAVRHPRRAAGRRGLPPRRRGPDRRRRPRRAHQGHRRRRRGRHGHGRRRSPTPPGGWKIAYDGPLPDARGPRLRRACSRPADATSASSARTARRAITGAGSTRSSTWSTAGTAAA